METNNVAIFLSEVSILPVKPKDGLLGFASFILNDHFFAGDIALHSRPDGGLRLVYPEKVLINGKRINVFHPITKVAGDLILSQVSEKYADLIKKRGEYGQIDYQNILSTDK